MSSSLGNELVLMGWRSGFEDAALETGTPLTEIAWFLDISS
jgi:hypothetical protein